MKQFKFVGMLVNVIEEPDGTRKPGTVVMMLERSAGSRPERQVDFTACAEMTMDEKAAMGLPLEAAIWRDNRELHLLEQDEVTKP